MKESWYVIVEVRIIHNTFFYSQTHVSQEMWRPNGAKFLSFFLDHFTLKILSSHEHLDASGWINYLICIILESPTQFLLLRILFM